MVLVMAALCLAALSLAGMAAAADSQATQNQNITSYKGNLSEKTFDFVSMTGLFGKLGFAVGEMTKFTSPKQAWKLKTVSILAYDGYNGTVASLPSERIIALEVRDKDRNLLYRMSDSQLPYSNYAFNISEPYWMTFELPSTIQVSGEFYVCFYDRGAVAVAGENLNKTSDNSFFYNMAVDEQLPATLPVAQNQTAPVNWIMSLSGS
jgi:hypothetical protein